MLLLFSRVEQRMMRHVRTRLIFSSCTFFFCWRLRSVCLDKELNTHMHKQRHPRACVHSDLNTLIHTCVIIHSCSYLFSMMHVQMKRNTPYIHRDLLLGTTIKIYKTQLLFFRRGHASNLTPRSSLEKFKNIQELHLRL